MHKSVKNGAVHRLLRGIISLSVIIKYSIVSALFKIIFSKSRLLFVLLHFLKADKVLLFCTFRFIKIDLFYISTFSHKPILHCYFATFFWGWVFFILFKFLRKLTFCFDFELHFVEAMHNIKSGKEKYFCHYFRQSKFIICRILQVRFL